MAESELSKKGREIRRELIGDTLVDKMATSVYDDPIMEKFGEYTREAIFGLLWARPGLDLKTRTLVCVVSDAATGAWPELAIHLRMARRQGWSEDALSEALLHLGGYIGVPSAREALIIAKQVFAELRQEGEGAD
ncbi:MAG: carboxymuconolactone decarboxylase family protein [Alphaproteobacteria bacterium]|jgi:4-carboxymuconolactone decarboxylase|nr:carboxymuconolactone decarboxylase family protein [Alphaproteobacteria bacterium]